LESQGPPFENLLQDVEESIQVYNMYVHIDQTVGWMDYGMATPSNEGDLDF